MEDVLEVYTQPHDEKRPLVCMDETSKQQIMEVRAGIEMEPGRAAKFDSEYKRNGVSNLFMFFAPLERWRDVSVTDRRTKSDWALAMRELSDVHFPEAERIVVVMDNLNTHKPSSFYEAFSPEEARRLVSRFEFHHTPKHGSWLNMAEIELSVLGRQCLSRRIPNQDEMRHQTRAWAKERNRRKSTVNWRFTTEDARIRLARLYPSLSD
jgi:hypothetical protein